MAEQADAVGPSRELPLFVGREPKKTKARDAPAWSTVVVSPRALCTASASTVLTSRLAPIRRMAVFRAEMRSRSTSFCGLASSECVVAPLSPNRHESQSAAVPAGDAGCAVCEAPFRPLTWVYDTNLMKSSFNTS